MKKILIAFILLFFNNIYSQDVNLESFGPSFNDPVEIKHAGDDRLFIVEQPGKIKILNADGTANSTPFLDIEDKVSNAGNEQGLLGLAFHPNYPSNPYFFVNYTNNSGNTVIAKYNVSSDPDIADTSETILLTISQPYSNHNGGCINFGPDGYLYIGMGDGGNGGDPQNYSQNLNSFLGKMLRIDVDNGSPYAIPSDNPFGDEIWASGLRNPWKFSFDDNGDLWIADVGQSAWEEINQVTNDPGGLNYGWRCYEGNHTYNTSSNCPDSSTLTFPVGEYSHSNSGLYKCSITGGYIYRGSQISEMNGVYFFADYCSGEIGMLSQNSSSDSWDMYLDSPNTNGSWVTFGEDIDGELYVASIYGSIYKITYATLGLNSCVVEVTNVDCSEDQFSVEVNVTDMGSSTLLTMTDDLGNVQYAQSTGEVVTFGPYTGADAHVITVEGDDNCNQTYTVTNVCNDECTGALPLEAGQEISGDTSNATDSGNNPSNDLWYSYTGDGESDEITISLCGSSYDTYIRIFDSCTGDQIAYNDDACGLQSEITFTSDGTTTYYIMVEGYSANNGAFVLSVSSTLGVDEIDLSNLKIYPNPTDGLIIFNNNPEPLDLIIYDINGRIVIERKNYFLQELNISELNAGIYFMQINNSYTQKIIKK